MEGLLAEHDLFGGDLTATVSGTVGQLFMSLAERLKTRLQRLTFLRSAMFWIQRDGSEQFYQAVCSMRLPIRCTFATYVG